MQELKQFLESVFNKEVKTVGNTLKVNVQSINANQIIWGLAEIQKLNAYKDVELKRSGTGITVIVTLEN